MKTPSFTLEAANGYCPGNGFEAIAIPNNTGSVTYNWYINGVLDSYHGYKIRKTFTTTTTTIGLAVVKSGCGVSNRFSQTYQCVSGFQASPNPANTDLTVETTTESDIKRAMILDKLGQKKLEKVYATNMKKVTFGVSHLPSDVYWLQIYDGTSWSAIQVLIQH